MEPQVPRRIDLVEALEACRPGCDDLADPDLAAAAAEVAADPALEDRFLRQQKLDVSLAGAIADVPVPPELLARLLAALEATPSAPPREVPALAAQAVSGRRRSPGWWFGVAGAVAALVLLALGLARLQRQEPLAAPVVLEQAISHFARDAAPSGRLVHETMPPRAFPLSVALRPRGDVRWRSLESFLDRPGVAYDMLGPRGARATLYVIRGSVPHAPEEPPARPAHETGNCSAALWQHRGLLYVLVVQGDARAYADLLDLPRGPVT